MVPGLPITLANARYGAWTLVINEDTRQKLGLAIEETSESTLACNPPQAGLYGKTDT
jgi:hypothetical protein